ncbi:MAG: hypothetical protein WD889_02630, partial [Candidatus Colwellbacteria bacterium]
MTLGRGLESLIPPKQPFDSNQQPQNNLEESSTPQVQNPVRDEENLLSETSGGERAWFDPAGRG